MLVICDPHPLILVVDDGRKHFHIERRRKRRILFCAESTRWPKDLFPAPFFRLRLMGKYLFRDGGQPAGIIFQYLPEVVCDGPLA